MKKQKPYVGQMAYYREQRGDDPQAAIVVHVVNPIVVSVSVLTPQGHVEPRMAANYWDGKGPQPTSWIVSEE